MILRDARPADFAAVRRLIGQLGYAPDEAEFRAPLRARAARQPAIGSSSPKRAARSWACCMSSSGRRSTRAARRWCRRWSSTARSAASGIGEALMREAEAWAAARKLAATSLYTRIDRDRARAFYERIGYRLKATSHLMGRA